MPVLGTKTYRNVSAKYMLKLIVKFLNRGDSESVKLWYVLTALRGPDMGNEHVKMVTTANLRGAIGIKPWNDCIVYNGPIESEKQIADSDRVNVGHHFLKHILNAKNALKQMGIIE